MKELAIMAFLYKEMVKIAYYIYIYITNFLIHVKIGENMYF